MRRKKSKRKESECVRLGIARGALGLSKLTKEDFSSHIDPRVFKQGLTKFDLTTKNGVLVEDLYAARAGDMLVIGTKFDLEVLDMGSLSDAMDHDLG